MIYQRKGFTLIEMLVALMILSVIGTAMVGTLVAATRLFELGERQRASSDEMMTVINLIDADISAAVPTSQGGHFYASLDPTTKNTFIGWTILNPDPTDSTSDAHEFVLWGIDSSDNLRRSIFGSHDILSAITDQADIEEIIDNDVDPGISDPAFSAWNTTTITANCWYFGGFLAAESDTNDDTAIDELAPIPDDHWWQVMNTPDLTRSGPAEPSVDGHNNAYVTYSSSKFFYPRALRLTMMIDTSRSPTIGILTQSINETDDRFRVAGLGQLPSGTGRFMRINNELIGYQSYSNNMVTVSRASTTGDPERGPLTEDSAGDFTGRGIYRTEPASHSSRTEVKAGQIYAITRMLPY